MQLYYILPVKQLVHYNLTGHLRVELSRLTSVWLVVIWGCYTRRCDAMWWLWRNEEKSHYYGMRLISLQKLTHRERERDRQLDRVRDWRDCSALIAFKCCLFRCLPPLSAGLGLCGCRQLVVAESLPASLCSTCLLTLFLSPPLALS